MNGGECTNSLSSLICGGQVEETVEEVVVVEEER